VPDAHADRWTAAHQVACRCAGYGAARERRDGVGEVPAQPGERPAVRIGERGVPGVAGRKCAADPDRGAGNAAQTWASGYRGSFHAWSYAKDAFDK